MIVTILKRAQVNSESLNAIMGQPHHQFLDREYDLYFFPRSGTTATSVSAIQGLFQIAIRISHENSAGMLSLLTPLLEIQQPVVLPIPWLHWRILDCRALL